MNYVSIVKLAQSAGLNPDSARIAAAIAMAESGGDQNSVTHDSDDDSYGLWQINMKGDMGPTRRKQLGIASNTALLNPATNARAMAMISGNGGNFSAWSTFTDQKYKKFLQVGNDISFWQRVKNITGITGAGNQAGQVTDATAGVVGGVTDSAQATAAAAGAAVDTLQKTAAWVSKSENWVRIAYVAGGGAIILVAMYQLMSGTAVGKAVKKGAKQAATVATSTASKTAAVAAV